METGSYSWESEAKVEGGKGKEKEQIEETTARATSPTPSATTTAPPVPEKDTAPAIPPRPVSQVQPLQPRPTPHISEKGQSNDHPYPIPVSNYNPHHNVLPHEPKRPPHSKSCNITKLVLSTASLIFSVVVVGLGIAVAAWGGAFSIQEGIFAITASTAGLAILWTAIDSVVTCLSHGRHRIPPGAHVAGHLIIWLMAMVSIIVLALNEQYGYSWTRRGYYTYWEIRQLELAILGLMVGLLLIHFILFIRACVETHSVNLASRRNRKHIVRYVHVPVPVDASGAPISLPPGAFFPQSYPEMVALGSQPPPGAIGYIPPPPQGYVGPAPVPPTQQAVLYSGYYAPLGVGSTQIDPPAGYVQPSGAMALHGYYGPPLPGIIESSVPPRRQSSNSGGRHSQRRASAGPSGSGSGSRRASRQNQAPPPAPAPAPAESS